VDDEIDEPQGFFTDKVPCCPAVAFYGRPFSGGILLGKAVCYLGMGEGPQDGSRTDPLNGGCPRRNDNSRQDGGYNG
jgi:hypothetical protein